MQQEEETCSMHTKCWSETLMGRGRMETCTHWEIILVLSKIRSGFVWLRIWKMDAAAENTVMNKMGSLIHVNYGLAELTFCFYRRNMP